MPIARNKLSINRISSAYHEAGHVIMSVAGLSLPTKVSIIPRGIIAGETTTLVPTVSFSSKDVSIKKLELFLLHSHLRMLLGGFAAEKKYFIGMVGNVPYHLSDSSDKDLVTYRKVVRKTGLAKTFETRKKLKKTLEWETSAFIERHWGVVKSVAHLLIHQDEVEYISIKRAMLDTKISSRYWKGMFQHVEDLVSACKGK